MILLVYRDMPVSYTHLVSGAADKDAAVKVAVSAIDKAQSKGVLHKNTAARKISRMAKRANKAQA